MEMSVNQVVNEYFQNCISCHADDLHPIEIERVQLYLVQVGLGVVLSDFGWSRWSSQTSGWASWAAA